LKVELKLPQMRVFLKYFIGKKYWILQVEKWSE